MEEVMDDAQLTIEDLQMVKSALWDVREKWKDLGVELSVTQTTLDSINITQRGDSGSCLREILAVWLKISGAGGTPRTWSSIIAALKEVEEMTVAKSIEYQLGASEVPIKSEIANVHRTSVPAMPLLMKWNVISVTAVKWRELGMALDIEPSICDTIKMKYCDPEDACRQMFSWWLSGEGSPCTWKELIESLKEVNFHKLAQQLEVCLDH